MDHPSLFSRPVPFQRMWWLMRGNRGHRAFQEETQLFQMLRSPGKSRTPRGLCSGSDDYSADKHRVSDVLVLLQTRQTETQWKDVINTWNQRMLELGLTSELLLTLHFVRDNSEGQIRDFSSIALFPIWHASKRHAKMYLIKWSLDLTLISILHHILRRSIFHVLSHEKIYFNKTIELEIPSILPFTNIYCVHSILWKVAIVNVFA